MATKKRSTKSTSKRDGTDNAPIFLRKTYEMINTCDPVIATWNDDGTSFVVKDKDKFERDIIPTFFKHNNFSSFVRQLNFYGFRKIKSDALRITDQETDSKKYFEFHHPKFLRGRPDLLCEIKKSSQIEPAEKQEVEILKIEVKDLKNQITVITKDMERLASLVGSIMKNQEEQELQNQMHRYVNDSATKKRRIASVSKVMPPSPVKSHIVNNESFIRPFAVPSAIPEVRNIDANYVLPGVPGASPPTPQPSSFTSKDNSIGSLVGSLSEYDEDLLATLLALDDDSQDVVGKSKSEVPDTAISSLPALKSMQDEQPDAYLVEQLRQSLNNLPQKLQELFVERLVNVIASPEAFHSQVEAVSALATIAAQEAKARLNSIGNDDLRNNNDENVLATAALGSFLARYGAALQGNKLGTNENVGDVDMKT